MSNYLTVVAAPVTEVLDETRAFAEDDPSVLETRAYRRFAARDHDALVRLYATGYWIARRSVLMALPT